MHYRSRGRWRGWGLRQDLLCRGCVVTQITPYFGPGMGDLPSRRSAARPLPFGRNLPRLPAALTSRNGLGSTRLGLTTPAPAASPGLCPGLGAVWELPGMFVAEDAVKTRKRGRRAFANVMPAGMCVREGSGLASRAQREHLSGPTGLLDLETSPFCIWAELKKTKRLLPSPEDLARIKGDFSVVVAKILQHFDLY